MRTPLLLLLFAFLLPACSSNGYLDPDDDDTAADDDMADDDAADDDVADDDSNAGDDAQAAMNNLTGWTVAGCGQVTVFAASGHGTVDLTFEAAILPADFNDTPLDFEQDYEFPNPVGGSLTVRSGENLGTDQCGGAGSPTVDDYYSAETGTLTLTLQRGPQDSINQTRAQLSFQGVTLLQVAGGETITVPDVTLAEVVVGS